MRRGVRHLLRGSALWDIQGRPLPEARAVSIHFRLLRTGSDDGRLLGASNLAAPDYIPISCLPSAPTRVSRCCPWRQNQRPRIRFSARLHINRSTGRMTHLIVPVPLCTSIHVRESSALLIHRYVEDSFLTVNLEARLDG